MKILCVGGGTLGSVTPLLAIIEKIILSEPGVKVEWWGTADGPEKQLVESQGIDFKPISAGKLRRYASLDNLKDLVYIFVGFVEALWRFGQNKPSVVLTAGSYVAVPVGWAAYFYNIPVFIHQQDVRVGLANKLLKLVAAKITVTLPESVNYFGTSKTVLTGNPVRADFEKPFDQTEAKIKLGLEPSKPLILVIGGGTGSQVLNDLVALALPNLIKITQIVHITGSDKFNGQISVPGYLPLASTTESITVLSAADLVISRAGMGVLTELSALKKPSVVVPIPASHQQDNADYFANHESIIIMPQDKLTPASLIATVSGLLGDKDKLAKLGQRLNELMPSGAAQKIADLVLSEINNGKTTTR